VEHHVSRCYPNDKDVAATKENLTKNEKLRRCEDVKMRRCEDEKM
jgi:hypothetical protein